MVQREGEEEAFNWGVWREERKDEVKVEIWIKKVKGRRGNERKGMLGRGVRGLD